MPFLVACSGDPGADHEVLIREEMAKQERAWDAGDIHGFMAGYAADVCFISRKGTTCGAQAVEQNYVRSYPDRASMGDLHFDLHEVVPAGTDHAWVTGGWRLVRVADTLSGGFSLLWHREPAGWRIIRDHTY